MKTFLWLSASSLVITPVLVQAQENRQPQERQQGQARPQGPQGQGQERGPGAGPRPARSPNGPASPAPSTARPIKRQAAPGPVARQPQRRSQTPIGQQSGANQVGPRVIPIRPQGVPVRSQPGRAQAQNAGRPRNFRPQQAAPFRFPRGYSYRRWSIGLLLPSIFLGSNYYYNGYSAVGVGAPPYGFRWVRYGSDLLLVNKRTGRIARVVYGAFY